MKPTYIPLTYSLVCLRIKILRNWHKRDLNSLFPRHDFVTIEYCNNTDLLKLSQETAKFLRKSLIKVQYPVRVLLYIAFSGSLPDLCERCR